MRSITFISLVAMVLGHSAQAEALVTPGCFMRAYTEAHLAEHPDQVVSEIWVQTEENTTYGETYLSIWARMAHQGHVVESGHAGQALRQGTFCFRNDTTDVVRCAVECDGGSLQIERDDGEALVFTTQYLTIGESDSCGGPTTLAERQGQTTTYLLNRVPDAACEERFE